jgi:pimeloyl-ACP methyl ester carboxylesterase
MLSRICVALAALFVALIALPPLWYTLSPATPPTMPPAGRRIELADGTGVNVIETGEIGEGRPIVLVHGLPGSAYDWRNTLTALGERGVRAIAYDRVGYGHSDPRAAGAPHTVETNADELLELLDAMDLEDVTVVGWSYGGATAMAAAMRAPERISHLVLVGTGGPDSADAAPPEPPGFMKFLYSDPVLAWRSRIPPLTNGLISASSEQAFSGQAQPSWWIPGVQANFARPETVLTYRAEMFSIEPGEFHAERIAIPTLLLHGDDDRLAPLAISEYLVTVIPGSELRITSGGSHMLPVTHANALAEAITGFSND